MWTAEGQQKRRFRVQVAAFLLLMSLVSASSRNLIPHGGNDAHLQGQSTEFLPPKVESAQGSEKEVVVASEETCVGLSKLGSRPPSCEHRCKGCIPCGAIQVPTQTDSLDLRCANYEPEDWKCKCKNAYFDP